jgi:DNA-binding CsgD family transcriptional regulator
MPMGRIQLPSRDLHALLDAVARCNEVQGCVAGAQDVLDALAGLIRCDVVFWNAFELLPRFHEQSLVSGRRGREVWRAPAEPWLQHRHEHPIMSGRFGPVVAVSDVLTFREFCNTWLWSDAFRLVGLRHEIGLELSHGTDAMNVVVLSRGPGRDFSERDHDVLRLLRPHVDAAIRRAMRSTVHLTRREIEVLRLVADGLSNRQIGRRLEVSDATVGKHLEHVYARTGVCNRVQAAALVNADR